MSRRVRRSLQNLGRVPGREPGREPGRSGRRGERFHVNDTYTWVSRSYESGETHLIALMRELRKGIQLKFWNRDVAVDGNVRESGDVGGNSRKTAGRAPHVAWCLVHSRWPLKIWRTEYRSRPVVLLTASGLQWVPVPNPSTVGELHELLTWRERTASCWPGDGLGTALSGSFTGRRTANSELVQTRGIQLFN
ncbi:hypothetical protein YC2023_108226 [Brassica napus]